MTRSPSTPADQNGPVRGIGCGDCSAPTSFLKDDDIRLAKEWAENLCIPWKTGDGWRSVACRLAHEVEGLRGRIAEQAMMERRYQTEIRTLNAVHSTLPNIKMSQPGT